MSNIPRSKPKHIVVIVADSLRYDSVYGQGELGVDYLENNSAQFTNASSSACWTLPATASLFTGKLPHDHGATTQTRSLNSDSVRITARTSSGSIPYRLLSRSRTSTI